MLTLESCRLLVHWSYRGWHLTLSRITWMTLVDSWGSSQSPEETMETLFNIDSYANSAVISKELSREIFNVWFVSLNEHTRPEWKLLSLKVGEPQAQLPILLWDSKNLRRSGLKHIRIWNNYLKPSNLVISSGFEHKIIFISKKHEGDIIF
jgi:hypothetical protein